jgi:hypothetical protein
LAHRLFAGALCRAFQDGDAVADLVHNGSAAGNKFLRRKNVGEDRLRSNWQRDCYQKLSVKHFPMIR